MKTDMADRILDKTLNKVQDGENLLHKLIRKLKNPSKYLSTTNNKST